MHRIPGIKRIVAALMLFIFIFSITPKQWLHDAITHHKDSWSVSFDGKQSITASGFHCGCDNLVVQSPFINYDIASELNLPEFFVQYHSSALSDLLSAQIFFSSLRGPPGRV